MSSLTPTTPQMTLASAREEATSKWRTLEDSLNLALQLRILSKSGDAEMLANQLSIRLVWLLLHSGFRMSDHHRYQLQQLNRDLSSYLSRSQDPSRVRILRRDLDQYQLRS